MTHEKKLPRAQRNNNPFNLKLERRNKWLGKIPDAHNTDGTFEQFESAAMGLRAGILLILRHYTKSGDNTVARLIRRWSETDQESYIATVAAHAGKGPDEPVDFRDYKILLPVIEAMISVENGNMPYKLRELQEGMMLAGVRIPT